MVPASRIRLANNAPMHATRPVVLYWMIAARRARANFGLEQAISHARRLRKPLVVLEALRVDHQWASDRLHEFRAGRHARQPRRVRRPAGRHLPALCRTGGRSGPRPARRAGGARRGGRHRRLPQFLSPGMVEAAGHQLDCGSRRWTATACCRCVPSATVYPTAHAFRRVLQKVLPAHLKERPQSDPLAEPLTAPMWPIPPDIALTMAGRVHLARQRRRDRSAADRSCRPPHRIRGRRSRRRASGCAHSSITSSPTTARNVTCPIATPPAGSRLSPLGPPRRARGVRAADEPRRVAGRSAIQGHRVARRLVGRVAGGRRLPRRIHHLARARLQHGVAAARLRRLRFAARLGPPDTRRTRGRPARPPLHARRVRTRRHARSVVERGADPAGRARVASTTTCECSGARRSCSGPRRRARPWL